MMKALAYQIRQKMENRRKMMQYFADLRSKVLLTAIPTAIIVTPDGVDYRYSESVEKALSYINQMETISYETECKEECGKSIRL